MVKQVAYGDAVRDGFVGCEKCFTGFHRSKSEAPAIQNLLLFIRQVDDAFVLEVERRRCGDEQKSIPGLRIEVTTLLLSASNRVSASGWAIPKNGSRCRTANGSG